MASSSTTKTMECGGALRLVLALGLGLAAGPVWAASDVTPLPIGYLEITDDPRYEQNRAYAGIQVRPQGRPVAGAELGIRENRVLGRALKVKFSLERGEGAAAADLIAEIDRLARERGVRFFIVDGSAEVLSQVADSTSGRDILLFNISERADVLRGAGCKANLMQVIPSHAMLTDALAQYLAAKKWRNVLVLKGPRAEDGALTEAFENSARRFGIRIAGRKDFVLSNDPREREKNNVALMTADGDYDVVFLADTDGEFGRYVPFQTNLPRPVIGTEGLIASAWNWSWERHGAPQLNQRFEKRAGRYMEGADWAAWAAVKAIVESVARTRSTNFKDISTYLKSDRLTLDAYKGTPSSFRSWDNQLRQPILLHTANAVIGRAPIKGFLHPTETMDTLGYDKGDGKC